MKFDPFVHSWQKKENLNNDIFFIGRLLCVDESRQKIRLKPCFYLDHRSTELTSKYAFHFVKYLIISLLNIEISYFSYNFIILLKSSNHETIYLPFSFYNNFC